MGLFSKQDGFQPGAYLCSRTALFEIVGRDGDLVELENVATGYRHSRPIMDLLRASMGMRSEYRIVKAAPEVPDRIEGF